MKASSVTSTMKRSAHRLSFKVSTNARMKFKSPACLAATLIAIVLPGPKASSRRSSDLIASANTKRVIGSISPSSVARPMNELGG